MSRSKIQKLREGLIHYLGKLPKDNVLEEMINMPIFSLQNRNEFQLKHSWKCLIAYIRHKYTKYDEFRTKRINKLYQNFLKESDKDYLYGDLLEKFRETRNSMVDFYRNGFNAIAIRLLNRYRKSLGLSEIYDGSLSKRDVKELTLAFRHYLPKGNILLNLFKEDVNEKKN